MWTAHLRFNDALSLVTCLCTEEYQELQEAIDDLRPEEVKLLGSLLDFVVNPLKRLFAWGVPNSQAIQTIKRVASKCGVMYYLNFTIRHLVTPPIEIWGVGLVIGPMFLKIMVYM